MNILFTICGRAGSKGFKNKNLKILNGIPLVYYTLAAIKLFIDNNTSHNIVVALNTDSIELINQIKKQEVIQDIVIIERKEELAGDTVAKIKVIQDTYCQCKELSAFEAVIDLDITSPLRRVEDIENAILEFVNDKEYDLVFSVVSARRSPYFNMVEKKGSYYKKICESDYTARQQAPKSYEMNASIYVYSTKFLERKIDKTILEYNCGIVEMPDFLVLDIDSEEDFEILKYIIGIFSKKHKELQSVIKMAKLMN